MHNGQDRTCQTRPGSSHWFPSWLASFMINNRDDSLENCSPADDDPALLCAHHELAGDGGLEAEAVDAGRELRVLGVG